MNKKFQVFISSTFRDLISERQDIIRAVLDLGHIPAGMEIFPASDQAQFDYIKKVIDECDYYVLVVGGRYGSLDSDGISFTEKEYDYAIERGLPVLSFVHGAPADISVGRSDIEPALTARLNTFREKVCAGRLVKMWTSREALQAAVVMSLVKSISDHPAVGWVRASVAANTDVLEQINSLRIQNDELAEKNRKLVSEMKPAISNLAESEDTFTCRYKYKSYARSGYGGGSTHEASVALTWAEIFAAVAPAIISAKGPSIVASQVERFLKEARKTPLGTDLFETDSNIIKIHLAALGLIRMFSANTVGGGASEFIQLTSKGHAKMIELTAVRK